jgi:Xaa-Pro aminopeptidase
LTGLSEPGATMVLTGGEPGSDGELTLFVRERDREAEVWSGRRIGPEGATANFGAERAFTIEQLAPKLRKLLDGTRCVYLPVRGSPRLQRQVTAALAHLHSRNRYGRTPPTLLGDARPLVGEDRIQKDAAALESLRRAVDLSAEAHVAAMRFTRPGMHEYEIEALVEYTFRKNGSTGPGYGSIVAGGDNATILHYVDNCDPREAGQLLLIDAGAEWDFHGGYITRTFPVAGTFSPAHRALYEVVLEANVAGIEQSVVGNDIDSIHEHCLRILCEGMRDLELLDASVDEIIEQELFKKFFPHRTSHWLGVDVHDAGWYTLEGKPRPLEEGFVFTVEPGLYLPADDESVPAELRGVGIRIEDDVLITASGPEILSHAAPKTVADIEALMAEGR